MNILVVKPCCLGDVLMTTPLVATLRAAYPQARIDFAVGDWARPAIAGNPDVDEIVDIGQGNGRGFRALLALAWRLRWRRYDIAFVPDEGWFSTLAVYLAGVPRRVGFNGLPRSLLLSETTPRSADEHEVDAALGLAAAAGLGEHAIRSMKYVPSQLALERALKLVNGHGFEKLPFRVALYPGGGSSPQGELHHKRWPPERYALLANQLITRYGGGVVLLGDEHERELNFRVRNDIDHPVLDLTGRLDVDEMAAVLQMCDAVIANDSGPMHLGVAVGTPTVALFGPTSARRFGPYGSRHRAVQGYTYCGPCSAIGGPMEGCGAVCMQRITVSDVVSVLEARAS